VALTLLSHYIEKAGLRGATEYIPRGLTILKGAVPGRTLGFGHMAPTYLCRFPGSNPTASRLRTCIFIIVMAGLVPAIHVLFPAIVRK